MTGEHARIHPAALEEAVAAVGWYSERSVRAAVLFLDELDEAIESIAQNPKQFPEYVLGTRRAMLHRFPYFVVFRETSSGLELIAVAHGRRRPGYWRGRT